MAATTGLIAVVSAYVSCALAFHRRAGVSRGAPLRFSGCRARAAGTLFLAGDEEHALYVPAVMSAIILIDNPSLVE